ncbi:type II secretion system F family protein [Idiomarina tyrosinivorans]|nr:type II secretion system F family protein [Idiomarina tyrosinivorans]
MGSRSAQWQWLEDFANWLEDGLGVRHGLEIMAAIASEVGAKREQQFSHHLLVAIRQGQTLATAAESWLANDLRCLLAIGEQHGCLKALLADYGSLYQQRQQWRRLFWRQAAYPLMIAFAVAVAMSGFSERILPALQKGLTQPAEAWVVDWASAIGHGLFQFGPGLLTATLMALFAWWLLRPQWFGESRQRLEKLGIGRGYRQQVGVELIQLLALLLRYGCSLRESGLLLRQHLPNYHGYHLTVMDDKLQRGVTALHQVFAPELLNHAQRFRLAQLGRGTAQRTSEVLWRSALRGFADIERQQRRFRIVCFTLLYGWIIGGLLLMLQAGMAVMYEIFQTL